MEQRRVGSAAQSGSSTIEVLIGAVLIATVVTALLSLMTANLKNSSEAVYREVATRVAQDGIELMRGQIALTTWNDFKTTYAGVSPAEPTVTLLAELNRNCSPPLGELRMGNTYNRTCTASCDAAVCTIKSTVTWNPWNTIPKTITLQQKMYPL